MRIVNTIDQRDLARAADAARRAEDDGYSGVVTLENRHDPFLPLAVAAVSTRSLELSTGVAIAFARSPMSVANIGWDLQGSSGGRFVLGLGPQIRAHNERRFSVPWSAPVPRLREYVASLRAIWRAWAHDKALDFNGDHYRFTLMPPNFRPEAMAHPPPPITLAAVGPAMLRLAGEVADGVRLHPFCTRAYLEQHVLPNLEHGWRRGGRERGSFEINGGGFLATGRTDAAVAEATAWVRQRVGFYGSTPAYWPVLESVGMGDLGPRLRDLTRAGDWQALAANVPDDLLQACAAIGRFDEIAARIEDHFGGIADTLPVSASYETPASLPPALIAAVRDLPTAFTGFDSPVA